MADRENKNLTEAQRIRMQQAADGRKAMQEYEAEAAAVRAKTARLRALRLGAEAAAAGAARATVAAQPKTRMKGKAAKGKKKPSRTLSDWLSDQAKDGR